MEFILKYCIRKEIRVARYTQFATVKSTFYEGQAYEIQYSYLQIQINENDLNHYIRTVVIMKATYSC